MVKIFNVLEDSLASKAKIKAGEFVISINGNSITDVLDYQFYCTERKLKLEIQGENEKVRKVKIKKDEYEDIGLEFETYLMDKQRNCRNNCIFCFIDQLPSGMRDSLYFKDDDSRLSFLFGNYITLTNIDEDEIKRIIKLKISPINISVHTTNAELRCKMMKNRFAGENLRFIDMLADAGIKLNTQLVLCPGVNDGDELRRSIEDLAKLYPSLESIAAVPVGVTKHRDGLPNLEPFTKEEAANVISIINEYGDKFEKEFGARLVYPADEFFNLAEMSMPKEEYYGDFAQLENGVGMCALLESEFKSAVDAFEGTPLGNKKTVVTAKGAYLLIKSLIDYMTSKWHNINCEVVCAKNDFFGEHITTTGLLTGHDLILCLSELEKDDLGTVLIPPNMLRNEGDLFLDNLSIADVEDKVGCKIKVSGSSGEQLFESIIGE